MIRLCVLGALLLALNLAALSLHTPGALSVGTPAMKTVFVGVLGISLAVYLLAVAVVSRPAGGRHALWVVLLIAAAMRLGPLLAPPFLSTDVFRYVWDGRVQAAGINPYRYVPADPALGFLRDKAVYPNIARADYARTIYPPTAQVIFAAVGQIWSSVTGVKTAMVAFELLAVLCLLSLLKAAALPPERVLIYAWNPLAVWAFAGNGHIDAAAIGLVAATILLRVRHRDGWVGVVLGAAILVKFLPAVIAPTLWRSARGWRMAILCGLTVLGLYALYINVGWHVFGYLSGYGAEEGLDSGGGFWVLAGLARIMPLPSWMPAIYMVTAALLLAGLGCWFAFLVRPDDPVAICAASGTMIAVLLFAISPHYPWYFAWLAVPAVLAPYRAFIWLAASPVLLYLDTNGDRFVWPSVVFVPALLLALADLRHVRVAQPIKGNI